MLAKSWKKILLAVCIIACIFNLTSKLVNRHSLKENLQSANDGETVFDIFKKHDIKVEETSADSNQSNTEENIKEINSDNQEKKSVETDDKESNDRVVDDKESDDKMVNDEENIETDNTKDGSFKFKDYTIIF